MRTRDGIILQARFASTRLPGKALERIGSRTLLEHCLARMLSADVARVVLDLLRSPKHALFSRVEMRPSQPPRKG